MVIKKVHLEETVNLAKNALRVSPKSLTVDLNTLGAIDSAGVYAQTLDENATPANHYPINQAGTLIVTPSAYGCQQEYTSFSSGRKFTRGLAQGWNGVDGPWKSWVEFYGTTNKPTPSAIGALAEDAVAVAAAKLSVARLINGVAFDGSKNINLPLIGYGQSWVDVTSQRSAGVTYTNTTGKPIQLLLDFIRPTTSWFLNIVVDGLTPSGAGGYCPVIPPGSTYRVNVSGITTFTWRELR
ncbi:pyocin knob domain-containing protein [Citrobacter freundii]|nr:pyocin knob domain-containing protein [Citrobacter freundii]MEB0407007.1 pyocin knob domain-containing protein [Citrobacter freundii]